MIIHPFSNLAYINTVTLPAIEAGLAKAGRTRDDFELSYSCFVVSGLNEEAFAASKKAAQERIAFYGSTPAYKGVLEAIGCGELQGELNMLSKQGRWAEMGTLISDDMLNQFGVMGEPHEIAPQMLARYGHFVDRTSASFPVSDEAQRSEIVSGPAGRIKIRCNRLLDGGCEGNRFRNINLNLMALFCSGVSEGEMEHQSKYDAGQRIPESIACQ